MDFLLFQLRIDPALHHRLVNIGLRPSLLNLDLALRFIALGIGLLVVGNSQSEEVTLLGLTVSRHMVKGMGIVSMIFSIIMLLVAYGSSLPARPADRRK